MRFTVLVPLVALLAGVAAAPVPEVGELAPRDPTWSFRCGLFGWRCKQAQNPPQPQPTTQAPPETTPPPESPPPTPTPTTPTPEPSQSGEPNLPEGCLTADFCPDTSLGQGGNPGEGVGTITYPNGTELNPNDQRGDNHGRDVEEREADLTPFLE